MPRKRYKPEEIVAKWRQVDVLISQGASVVDAIRQIGVSEVTFYRWRQESIGACPSTSYKGYSATAHRKPRNAIRILPLKPCRIQLALSQR